MRIRNDRILAVPTSVRREAALVSIDSLPQRIREELEQFTIAATSLEGKDVRIVGWGDAKTALKLIEDAASVTRDA